MKKISIIGSGYVGLTTALSLASVGNMVFCLDIDDKKVTSINKAKTPFYELGLQDLLQKMIREKLIIAAKPDQKIIQETDITIIAVPTPTKKNTIHLEFIKQASQIVGKSLKNKDKYHLVIVKSTVIPGTTRNVVGQIISQYSQKIIGEFGLCMNPEFLREGSAISDALNPDRIVIGAFDIRSGNECKKLYQSFKKPMINTTLETAELIKYTSNALYATLISFSNEIAQICQSTTDVDVEDVWSAIHLDHRLISTSIKNMPVGITKYLRSGCGYGGSCFPKDTRAIVSFAESLGVNLPIIKSGIIDNNKQPKYLLNILQKAIGSLSGKKITVLGLSFKPETDDIRESPGVIFTRLLIKNHAHVICHDPVVKTEMLTRQYPKMRIKITNNLLEAISNSDAVVITTAWEEYRLLEKKNVWKKMKLPVIIDGRRILSPHIFQNTPVKYYGVGRSLI